MFSPVIVSTQVEQFFAKKCAKMLMQQGLPKV